MVDLVAVFIIKHISAKSPSTCFTVEGLFVLAGEMPFDDAKPYLHFKLGAGTGFWVNR